MATRNLFWKLLLLPLLASPTVALADPVYTMTFLPAQFTASGMNNAGSIVGTISANGNAAAVWTTAGITDIGAIAPGSIGMAINDRGDIGGGWRGDAFAYSGGVLTNIGQLGSWQTSFLTDINSAGQMAGSAHLQGGENARGFFYSDGVVQIIPTFGGAWSSTAAINASGQVVGTSTLNRSIANPKRHAFVFQDQVATDLGTLGGVSSEANDINDAGKVVGMSQVTPDQRTAPAHAFVYENGVMRDLGLLGGSTAQAYAINNAGLIVGTSEWNSNPQDGTMHAFLYANDAMVDLNSLIDPAAGWQLTSARDINDAGQILATACRSGECAAVRLDLAAPVPEPRAWGLLLVGLMLVASKRRASSAEKRFS